MNTTNHRSNESSATHNPYQAPSALSHQESEYEYAGFWIRVAANLIDGVILILIITPLAMLFMQMGLMSEDPDQFSLFEVIFNLIISAIYIWLWVKYAGTPGHRLLKLKILDADTGEHLTVGRAIIRYIVWGIGAALLLLGLIWVAFDKRKQGWHDKAANSVVVKEL